VSGRARRALRRTRLRLPIRLRLAVVSAGLTFVILLLFALVVGAFTERRLMSSFDDDLRATGADVRDSLSIKRDENGQPQLFVPERLLRAAASGDAAIRVVDRSGRVIRQTQDAPLGPPYEGLRDIGAYRVVARPLFAGALTPEDTFGATPDPVDGAIAYVQYAKPRERLDSTAARLHLFLALGVLGGTSLAFLAGFAVARRAMRPIAGLTQAAREVARTRDPGKSLPRLEAHDEVAELAETLEEMLAQLDAARGETEAALERQREFVADASHELRTPLTSILANLELLEEELLRETGLRDREAAAESATSALRSSRRMRRLVGDLLLLARADAGRRAPARRVDLAIVARDAAEEAGPLAPDCNISLDLPEEGVAALDGAPDDLHRLVLNLVENALLHTPPGTPVVVAVAREGSALSLEVSDRGPGVPTELRDRIFDRFAREAGDEVGNGGSGLGLAIVRAVVQAHGGSVTVDEAPGGGARFTVKLDVGEPISRQAQYADVPPAADQPSGL